MPFQTLYLRFAAWLALFCSLWLAPLAMAADPSELLPPEKAFPVSVERQGNQLQIRFQIAKGYYLYRDRIKLAATPASALGPVALPPGKIKQDPFLGRQAIYPQSLSYQQPLAANAPARFTLKVTLQGCAEVGVCYPPYTHTIEVGGKASGNWFSSSADPDGGGGNGGLSRTNWPATLLAFFVAGIGMAFTACMYPLLPIVSSLIAGHGHGLSGRRGFLLAFTYAQGLAITYTGVGVLAGLTGSLLTVWLQQPAVVLSASALLVLLAMAMFGLISLQLPNTLQTRLTSISNRLPGGRYTTVFGMGMLSALIVGPCVAPPLALALGYIGSSGDALLGGAALYSMALGLGLPLLLVGAFGGRLLPHAGAWMNTIRSVFGAVMLALAIWMASPFLPIGVVMLLWAALGLGSAVFLRAFEPLPVNAHGLIRIGKALGLGLFLFGAAQIIGLLSGQHDLRFPLKGLFGGTAQAQPLAAPSFQPIRSEAELDAALQAAGNRPVLLDFYADWCVSCRELEADTFPDPQVAAQLRQYTLLRADVTANSATDQALLKRFGLFGPPGLILMQNGAEKDRIIGFINAAELTPKLAALLISQN